MAPLLSRTCRVPGTIEGAHEGLEALEAFARDVGLTLDENWQAHVALDEWLTNVARHAYRGVEGGVADIRMSCAGREVVIEVADDGPPFDPLSLPPPDTSAPIDERLPGGLGVYFITRLMARVTYRREANRNILTFAHAIPPRQGGQAAAPPTRPAGRGNSPTSARRRLPSARRPPRKRRARPAD